LLPSTFKGSGTAAANQQASQANRQEKEKVNVPLLAI